MSSVTLTGLVKQVSDMADENTMLKEEVAQLEAIRDTLKDDLATLRKRKASEFDESAAVAKLDELEKAYEKSLATERATRERVDAALQRGSERYRKHRNFCESRLAAIITTTIGKGGLTDDPLLLKNIKEEEKHALAATMTTYGLQATTTYGPSVKITGLKTWLARGIPAEEEKK